MNCVSRTWLAVSLITAVLLSTGCASTRQTTNLSTNILGVVNAGHARSQPKLPNGQQTGMTEQEGTAEAMTPLTDAIERTVLPAAGIERGMTYERERKADGSEKTRIAPYTPPVASVPWLAPSTLVGIPTFTENTAVFSSGGEEGQVRIGGACSRNMGWCVSGGILGGALLVGGTAEVVSLVKTGHHLVYLHGK